ncbi:hypothetical protein GKA01_21240 [Gluconobacter kanchanaburiensis NBRC 103587]|uniref:Uncharacterized protein n=1 Tax=Gluconobacter kanchanaburiensis NBRC 103587 TaxID=1307948 RepID=A0A511BGJ4_9PROT|nr:hypothetical protein GKA01_21240 [Gluconobacter kanchanaburiensis NBRC 103587]
MNYFGMAVGNVSGGMQKCADYAGKTSVDADAGWELLAGLNGFGTPLYGRPGGRCDAFQCCADLLRLLPVETGWAHHWGKSQKPLHLRASFYACTA